MRAVFQRVSEAWVEVDGTEAARIAGGALLLIGVEEGDTRDDALYIAEKCANLRVFDDEEGRLNCSVQEVEGAMLVVSQFTLCGDCRKGRRPSYAHAAAPERGRELYELVARRLKELGIPVRTGTFRAHMRVHLVNDGPVTLLLDSRRQF
jgi:D-tyrosyl-tRNA(Tyr) deacylase